MMWQDINLAQHRKPGKIAGVRLVEDQNRSATFKLTDTLEEHQLLEKLLEDSKPPKPSDCPVDDYLLFTPFRYPPLREGTRFGRVTERSPFYGSQTLPPAMAEMAHKQFRFMEDTEAEIPPFSVHYTSFSFHARTASMLDLTAPPFDGEDALIHHAKDYTHSQKLAAQARKLGVELLQYRSVRLAGGTNFCLFTPRIFTRKSSKHRHWLCFISPRQIGFYENRELYFAVNRL
jgi:hypothetical protein